MSLQRVHTREFSAEARERLGLAITRAREASGHPHRPSFAKVAGLSVRSIVNLEAGTPVGPSVYEAAARALPGWNEDTPRMILEGSPAPEIVVPTRAEPRPVGRRVSAVITHSPNDPEFWEALKNEVPPERYDDLWQQYLAKKQGR
jgi:hypothetical protein